MTKDNIVLMWLLGLLAIVGFVLFLLGFVHLGQAEATFNPPTPKVNICHCQNPNNCQTLNIAIPAAIAHLAQHNNDYQGVCRVVTPSVTPSVTPDPTPQGGTGGGSVEAPKCPNGNTTKVPANAHVIRNKSKATVNFFLTEGDSANIYWGVNGKGWQHAVSNVKPVKDNFISYVVNSLDAKLGYTFGIQQKSGCGGGHLITAVIIDPPAVNKVFRVNYYQ